MKNKIRVAFCKTNFMFSLFLLAIWETAKELGGGQRPCLMSLKPSLIKKGLPTFSMPYPSIVYWASLDGFNGLINKISKAEIAVIGNICSKFLPFFRYVPDLGTLYKWF